MRDIDSSIVEAVMEDWTSAPIDERLRLALGVLQAMTLDTEKLDERLKQAIESGLPRAAIDDVAAIGFHFNQINRIADAVDFPSNLPNTEAKIGRLLDRAGAFFSGRPADIEVKVDTDGIVRPVAIAQARAHLLSTEGVLQPHARRAVEAHTARLLGGERTAPDVPEELVGVLDKLARFAYRIVDEDVEGLRAAGYDDVALHEIILVGAMGAATAKLEQVYAALARVSHQHVDAA